MKVKLNPLLNNLKEKTIVSNSIVKYLRKGIGCCANYAFKLYPKKELFAEDCFNILEKKYKNIRIEKSKPGDIISFHKKRIHKEIENENNCTHFAKIRYTNGTQRGTIIRSKWGKLSIFEGRLDDLPRLYGNSYLIWRKKRR